MLPGRIAVAEGSPQQGDPAADSQELSLFPVAYRQQTRCYLAAAAGFDLQFERITLDVPYRSGSTPVVVHRLMTGQKKSSPTILMLGGVDTWKMDIHASAVPLAKGLNAIIALVDMAGVGESGVPNAPDADLILAGGTQRIRGAEGGKVGAIGFSFGRRGPSSWL